MAAALAAVAAPAPPRETTKHILVLPALQWDAKGASFGYAAQQTVSDLARAMAGLKFGMIPEEVGQHLSNSTMDLHWGDLAEAKEFSDDVRYAWLAMQAAGALRAPVAACFGEPSYLVLLFRANTLFRISWRFLPDQACADPRDAAEQQYAAFTPLATTVAVSAHYRTGYAEVVDVTDPSAGSLVGQRWQMTGQ